VSKGKEFGGSLYPGYWQELLYTCRSGTPHSMTMKKERKKEGNDLPSLKKKTKKLIAHRLVYHIIVTGGIDGRRSRKDDSEPVVFVRTQEMNAPVVVFFVVLH
jgi:hypothetical protein